MSDEKSLWRQRNTAVDLDLLDAPWQAAKAVRRPDLATHVAEFAEMLCQIDGRFDVILPACWMRHGYIFSVIDALRCEYASAYVGGVVTTGGGPRFVPARQSREQTQFWIDENAAYGLIKDYCASQSIGGEVEAPHDTITGYSRQTEARRSAERALGIDAVECYPFDVNALSPMPPDGVAAVKPVRLEASQGRALDGADVAAQGPAEDGGMLVV